MPDSRQCNSETPVKYDSMRTEELQQILREDASKPAREGSDIDILYIMNVLAKRRKEQPEEKSPEEALAFFRQEYQSGKDIPVIFEDPTAVRKRHCGKGWKRGLVTAAAALALVIGSSIATSAFQVAPQETIVRWTTDTFYFVYAGQTGDMDPDFCPSGTCAGLQHMLENYQIPNFPLPTWLPDGYLEKEIKATQTPVQRIIDAYYDKDDRFLSISIRDFVAAGVTQYQQSGGTAEVYTHKGIDYYIFHNYDECTAAWIYGNFECSISGDLSVSEMKQIIDSI